MEHWVQTCPHCGYVYPDIKTAAPSAIKIVRSDAYQTQRRDQTVPELARRFLCHSMLEEALGNPLEAGWASLHAAWACDDAPNAAAASYCRRRALAFFQRAADEGMKISRQGYAEYPLITDLMRRIGEFEQALEYCNRARPVLRSARRLPKNQTPAVEEELRVMTRILVFEKNLILRHDVGAHTVGEALGKEGIL